jgi:hypothetical protein
LHTNSTIQNKYEREEKEEDQRNDDSNVQQPNYIKSMKKLAKNSTISKLKEIIDVKYKKVLEKIDECKISESF